MSIFDEPLALDLIQWLSIQIIQFLLYLTCVCNLMSSVLMPLLMRRQWKKFQSKQTGCFCSSLLFPSFRMKSYENFLLIIFAIIFIQFNSMDSIINQKKRLHETLLSFPPFYTLQEHEQSRKKQIGYWGELIHTYCREHNLINSSVSEIWNLPLLEDRSTSIPKKLSKEDTLTILKDLERLGCVEFVIGSEKILISHFSPYEMADDMYRWAKQNYLLGDVETLQFIAEGQQTTPKEKFYKQPKEILLKVIDILQKQQKAVRIQVGSDIGIKFLQ